MVQPAWSWRSAVGQPHLHATWRSAKRAWPRAPEAVALLVLGPPLTWVLAGLLLLRPRVLLPCTLLAWVLLPRALLAGVLLSWTLLTWVLALRGAWVLPLLLGARVALLLLRAGVPLLLPCTWVAASLLLGSIAPLLACITTAAEQGRFSGQHAC